MITQTQTIKAIRDHLEKEPGDWDSRRMLADLYEDMGDENRSKLQRWLIDNRKYPHYNPQWEHRYNRHWYWWNGNEQSKFADLGRFVLKMKPENYIYGGYATCEEAEEELLKGLIKHDWNTE